MKQCSQNNHEWPKIGSHGSYNSSGNLLTERCNNCLASRITQEWDVYDGGEWVRKTRITVVEDPRGNGD